MLQDTLLRGEELKLKSNSDNTDWVLWTASGKMKTLPGACFMIPPPDAEAVDKVNRYRQTSSSGRRMTYMKWFQFGQEAVGPEEP